jgi:hypothetical protein
VIDRSTKIILAIIAINLTIITTFQMFEMLVAEATAQSTVNVRIIGGRLDYSTDVSGGPTLEVKPVR